ncbi:MAG: hypothetical protein NE334_12375 [Lentisphaeraceae bacterium]|nr:hypothetical protein [Lentisphaeraceae bacterium]
MIIKHMDHIAQNGQFDLDLNTDVNVYLAEIKGFTKDKGLAEWEIVGEEEVSPNLLHYDDTADGSNALNGSWREFFASEVEFGEKPLYSGSAIFFKDGLPNFRGVAKAVIYLRYSVGFLNWLKSFDLEAAQKIEAEKGFFEKLIENPKTKKLIGVWDKFKAPRGQWPLPVICTLTDSTKLIFGLKNSDEADWEDLEEKSVNITRSLEVMSFFEKPQVNGREVVSEVFQMGGGLGRNAFGKSYKLDIIPDSEYVRLMGTIPEAYRTDLLSIWANKVSYRIKVSPNPDSSELIYMPEGDLEYSELKSFNDAIQNRKTRYFETRKDRSKSNEDVEGILTEKLNLVPIPQSDKVTLYLVNTEGAQKKKIIIQEVFPSVSLEYLELIDSTLLSDNTQNIVVNYLKKALTAQDRDTPSVYHYWTKVFTSLLQKKYISANEIFYSFQRYCKAFRGDELIEKGKAREYFKVINSLKRLQQLIHVGRSISQNYGSLRQGLMNLDQNSKQIKGVFLMSETMPDINELVGEVYENLWDKQQEKLKAFIKLSWSGVPSEDFPLFVRGGLVGILLNELTWTVKNEGRSFSVTQGRHPSTLRGTDIQRVVEKGIGLLIGLDKQHRFNGKAALFIQACIKESRKDAFNSGLIMGLVFIHKSTEEGK